MVRWSCHDAVIDPIYLDLVLDSNGGRWVWIRQSITNMGFSNEREKKTKRQHMHEMVVDALLNTTVTLSR